MPQASSNHWMLHILDNREWVGKQQSYGGRGKILTKHYTKNGLPLSWIPGWSAEEICSGKLSYTGLLSLWFIPMGSRKQ
jgi:hypothetical protein